MIGQSKFEYHFRKILSVGKIPTTINSHQARSIATCICLLSLWYTVTNGNILQLYRESDNIILIGDMNINMKGKVSELLDLCDLYNLKNIVKKPTCFKYQDNPSLINVILVAKPRHLHETVVFDTGLSDFHKIICVCTKVYVPWEVPRKIVYRSFNNF